MAYPTEALFFDMMLDGKIVPYVQESKVEAKENSTVNTI